MMKKLTCILAAGSVLLASCDKTPRLGEASIEDVIAAMTLEEKAHLVVGTGMEGCLSGDSAVVGEPEEKPEEPAVEAGPAAAEPAEEKKPTRKRTKKAEGDEEEKKPVRKRTKKEESASEETDAE